MTQHPDTIRPEKHVYDNVHGFIGVTELETKVIDSPFFQRLRRIKQLSLLEYVFPGAVHNRFNHSLGVMHVADKIVVHLQEQEYLEGQRELIRMAALLHDVGHYPLSHLVEHVVRDDAKLRISDSNEMNISAKKQVKIDNGRTSVEHKRSITDNEPHKLNHDWHSHSQSKDYAHHERMAGVVIQNSPLYDILTEDTFSSEDIKKMGQIIFGSYLGKGPESLIIHSELDADRFDYLLRDSKQTGVIYGLFDMDQIIRNLKYIEGEGEDKGRLVVDKKAIKAVEHYLMCRYFLYNTVVYHKATVGFEIMAQRVYDGLMERGIFWSYFELIEMFKSREDANCYLHYDDSYFFDTLKEINRGNIKLPPTENPKVSDTLLLEFIDRILNRKPLKLVFEKTELIDRKAKANTPLFLEELFKEKISTPPYSIEEEWCIPFENSVAPTSISPHINLNQKYKPSVIDETIRIFKGLDKNGNPNTEFIIYDSSSVMSVLGNYELHINRLYTKDENYKNKIRGACSKK